MPRNRSNTFWLSYSDLMTSLFFIMLVLFIVCVVKMKGINDQLDKEVNAKEEQLRKIEELNNSIKLLIVCEILIIYLFNRVI